MTRLLSTLAILFITFFYSVDARSHAQQFVMCIDCTTGDVTIWVEHNQGEFASPAAATMDFLLTVDGVPSNMTLLPDNTVNSLINVTVNDLPCAGTLTSYFSCPIANTTNDWVSYTFAGLPFGVPITIEALAGSWGMVDLGCAGIFPNTTGSFTISPCAGSCLITNLTAVNSPCDPATNTYSTTGQVDFTDPPAIGQLIVSDCNGFQQVFNAPFVSPINYNITGQLTDGAPCDVTAVFTNDPVCTSTVNYNAPVSCLCTAQIGTFTANITGTSINNYVLCYGDQIDITSNGDWVAPGEIAPPDPNYNPGVTWLVYSCPPSVAVTPDPVLTISDDPCFLGFLTDFNISDLNDMSFIDSYPPGTFPDNIVYYVPITMYSMSNQTYSTILAPNLPCYELGSPYPVQYLPEFTFIYSEDCLTGEAVITVNGGLPQIDGSSCTATNLLPATASFSNTSANNGGTIAINGLQPGDMWSFTIDDGNSCPYIINGGPFPSIEDPGFNFVQTSYCQSEAGANPIITGISGGTFTSSPAGLTIDPATGFITPGTSTPGTYDVTYTTSGSCFDDLTLTINIAETPMIDPIPDQTICEGEIFNAIIFTGSLGATFDWTNGNINIGLSGAGSGDILSFAGITTGGQELANITVTPSAGNCIGAPISFSLSVGSIPTVLFQADQTNGCEPFPVTFSNLTIPSGSTCSWSFGDGTSAIGCTNVSHIYMAGDYDVTLTVTTANGCSSTTTITDYINVIPMPVAAFSFSPQILTVDNTTVDFTNSSLDADSYEWTFGDNSSNSNSIDPNHFYPEEPGTYLVTLIATNSDGPCTSTTEALIIIQDGIIFYVPNVFTPDGDEYNEGFQPIFTSGYDPYDFHMMIYNRWGELIFESYNANAGWNGTYSDRGLVEDGVYIWSIDFKETMSDKRHKHFGHVTVLK